MGRHKLPQQVIATSLLVLFLVGCTTSTPIAIVVTATPPAPSPVSPTSTPTLVSPTPTPRLPVGTVRGILMSASSGKPLSGSYGILVAVKAEGDLNTGEIVTVDFPKGVGETFIGNQTEANARGEFVVDLSRVPPGKYFLILMVGSGLVGPFSPSPKVYLLKDRDGQKVIADLTLGDGVDVGQIFAPIK